MDDTAQPEVVIPEGIAAAAEGPGFMELATAQAEYADGGPVTAPPALESPAGYVLTAAQVAAAQDEIGERPPAPVTGVVDRPDGRPGYAEQLAGAILMPPEVAAARRRLDDARAVGDEVAIDAAQRELAAVAGYRLREHDQPLPTDGQGPVIHELVVVDLMNRLELGKKRYGQGLRAHNGRNALRDAYDEVLDLAVYLRQALEEQTADGADDVPEPPATRARVVVVQDQPWLWRPDHRQWVPLVPNLLEELSPKLRAAVEAHTGPLGT